MTHMTVKSLPKPAKGAAKKAQRSRRRAIETRETRAKALARERDEYRCRRCGVGPWPESPWPMLEAAHIIDKGMGGDHGKYSHLPKHFVTLCHDCHQGPRSLHSGDVAMAWHPEHMGDGEVKFLDVERAERANCLGFEAGLGQDYCIRCGEAEPMHKR